MIICYKAIQACVKILYRCMLSQASLLAAVIMLYPICNCDWSKPFSAWVTENSDYSTFPVVTVLGVFVHGTDLMVSCGCDMGGQEQSNWHHPLDLCRAFGAAHQDILVCKQERRDLTSRLLGERITALKVTLKVSCSQWFKCPSAELWRVVSLRGWYWDQSSSTPLPVTRAGREGGFLDI